MKYKLYCLGLAFVGFAFLEVGAFLIYRPVTLILLGGLLIGAARAGLRAK